MRDGVLNGILDGTKTQLSHIAEGTANAHQLAVVVRRRVMAYEQVFLKPRFGLVKAIFLSVFWPGRLMALVDDAHVNLMQERARKIQEQAQKAQEEAAKPKLIVPLGVSR